MRMLLLCGVSLLLGGCFKTWEQHDTEQQAKLNNVYAGRPLADFMFKNNILPIAAFDTPDGGRLFRFSAPCHSTWYTRRIGSLAAPSDFEVIRVEITGYCV